MKESVNNNDYLIKTPIGEVGNCLMQSSEDGNSTSNKIIDYISGELVPATPEEIEAVQVFCKILHEDYGYPKEHIQAHPQFRVKASPSDTEYRYPIDITVFSDATKERGKEYIVVECKRQTREDGIEQLKHYLKFSDATLGVWFNGNHTHYILKTIEDGKIQFKENIVNIPSYQQRLEDIGLFKKRDLEDIHNLKSIFISTRNYLAGNNVGSVNDIELAKNIIRLILCKLYDEKYTQEEQIVKFRAGINEDPADVQKRILELFEKAKVTYNDIFEKKETIDLTADSITYVVGQLQKYSLMKAKRDVIGDAFEVFIHRALKGGQGQYFTPKNVVRTAVEILDPQTGDLFIDPACGSGGFLIEALKYYFAKIDKEGAEWPFEEIVKEKVAKAGICFHGIEIDSFLSKVVKAYMILMGDGKSGIFNEDSLKRPTDWSVNAQARISLGRFDVLLANPPFGSKIAVKGEEKLKQYPLAHKWIRDKKTGVWSIDYSKLKEQEAPQILFIDRCLDLVKEGGKLGLVLPDGMLSNPTHGYIVQEIMQRAEILGVIDLPMSTFLPFTPTKTHLIFLKRTDSPRKEYSFFMSYAKTCGHDKRGRETKVDEISLIPDHLEKLRKGEVKPSLLGWYMKTSEIKNNVLLPKFYSLGLELNSYKDSGAFELKKLSDLEKNGIIKMGRGVEIGSDNYGTGEIPFIRTSEISNWEITSDVTHCTSQEVYEKYKDRLDIEAEDILVVNDGTYLMGRTAMITEADTMIVIQSHFRKIKVLKKDVISPYLLLALLGLETVQKQIESMCIRQGTISTLGNRLKDVIIPIPTDEDLKNSITESIKTIMVNKANAKLVAQSFEINGKIETLMGIQNKATIGNL